MKYQETRSNREGRRLQERQLAYHRAARGAVVIHLTNGVRLSGIVVGADAYMVLLARDAQDPAPQIVYKHAVAAITPDTGQAGPAPWTEEAPPPEFVRLYTPRTRTRRRG